MIDPAISMVCMSFLRKRKMLGSCLYLLTSLGRTIHTECSFSVEASKKKETMKRHCSVCLWYITSIYVNKIIVCAHSSITLLFKYFFQILVPYKVLVSFLKNVDVIPVNVLKVQQLKLNVQILKEVF